MPVQKKTDNVYRWHEYTISQLKQVAKKHNITGISKLKKSEIIRKLQSNNVCVPSRKPRKVPPKAKPKFKKYGLNKRKKHKNPSTENETEELEQDLVLPDYEIDENVMMI